MRGRSSVGSAQNCRFAVVGVGFEEVALLDASGWIVLLDAVDYGGLNGAPAGRFLDVSGWVGVPLIGIELGYEFGGSWGLFPQSIPR